MRTILLLPVLALAALVACSSPTKVQGQVVDIWGNPLRGVTLKRDGSADRPVSDGSGFFTFAAKQGTYTVKAGKQGYIQQDLEVTVNAEGQAEGPLVFELTPVPAQKGFHLVGSSDYELLAPMPVKAVGNDLRSLYGMQDIGEVSVDKRDTTIVYHTDLRLDQVMRLGLELHKLAFVHEAELTGALTTQVKLNLWTHDATLPLTIEPMRSRTDYALTTEQPLEPGAYALTTNDLLDPVDDDAFRRIAKPLRVAFPFEVR